MYVYHVLLYRNENDNMMYEMIDERLNCNILVKKEIIHFKLSSLPFSFM